MDEAGQSKETAGTCHQQPQINLDEIKNISEDEFKQQLLNWIETNCVAKTMQSKLRKDLIDNFNRTNLGRQIAFHHQQSHRIVLSSLILALNTLVAEFLYAQNCHFSLSVFSTEVPYKNTMPDFENVNNFRFSIDELHEIFEALGLIPSSTICKNIVAMYSTQGSRVNTSLLYGIVKVFITQIGKNATDLNLPSQPSQQTIPVATTAADPINVQLTDRKSTNSNCRHHNKSTRHHELNVRYFKHFNSYLDLLAKHIIEMNRKMENLRNSKTTKSDSIENCEKLDNLNRTLDKITENLTNLSKTNRQGRKLSAIIKCVTNLTTEIEKCSENFEQLSIILQNEQQTAKKMLKSVEPKSYNNWLSDFNASPYSKIYLADLERSQCSKIAVIRQEMTKDFDEKLEINRRFIRLHYKEKMLEKCKSSFGETLQMNRIQRETFNEMIDTKLKLVKDLKMNCVQRQNDAATSTINYEMVMDTKIPKMTKDIGCGDGVLMDRKVDKLSLHKAASINIEAIPDDPIENKENNEQIVKTNKVVESEPYADYVVEYARQRLQELEIESERLDKSFQSYLQRQEQEKHKIDSNVTKIWENYKINKQFLSQTNFIPPKIINVRDTVIPTATSSVNLFDLQQQSLKTVPTVNDKIDDKFHLSLSTSTSPSPINLFQNPYRQISVDEICLAKTIPFEKKLPSFIGVSTPQHVTKVAKKTSQSARNAITSVQQQNEKSKEMQKIVATKSLDTLPNILPLSDKTIANDMIFEDLKNDEINNINEKPMMTEDNDISRSIVDDKNFVELKNYEINETENPIMTDNDTKESIINNVKEKSMIMDSTKESVVEDDPVVSQIATIDNHEPFVKHEIHQLQPTVSSMTFLIDRNQSNEFLNEENQLNNAEDDALSIGGKNSDSSDDFWK